MTHIPVCCSFCVALCNINATILCGLHLLYVICFTYGKFSLASGDNYESIVRRFESFWAHHNLNDLYPPGQSQFETKSIRNYDAECDVDFHSALLPVPCSCQNKASRLLQHRSSKSEARSEPLLSVVRRLLPTHQPDCSRASRFHVLYKLLGSLLPTSGAYIAGQCSASLKRSALKQLEWLHTLSFSGKSFLSGFSNSTMVS
jgi:hypothetical protein